MKRRGFQIGITIFTILAVSFVILFIFVHFFLSNYMETNAYNELAAYIYYTVDEKDTLTEEDIASIGGEENLSENNEFDMFEVMMLETDFDYNIINNYNRYEASGDEYALVRWCKTHKECEYNIVKKKIHKSTYFVTKADSDKEGGKYIMYVNFSAAEEMLTLTEMLMIIIMSVCVIFATIFGLLMGRRIKKEQEKQKYFFENASHELKTPLMSIQGYAEGLKKGIVTEEEHAYSIILNESKKMSRMVDEIMFLSKYDRGIVTNNIQNVSVEEITGDCLDALAIEIRKKGISVHTDIHDSFIKADEEQIRRAVSNVISNAVRYAETELRITFSDNCLEVWDDGDMIEEDELARVFERFHTGKKGNTGIGLALARDILKSHGYKITAENYNNGVRFMIVF